MQRLRVSGNRRYLVTEDGAPFFYLGDTGWELFHRLNREDAEHYLRTRAEQGFTVIQAVLLSECDGLDTPNAYGARPLNFGNPRWLNETYIRHVDWIIERATANGLYLALLPAWGRYVSAAWQDSQVVFNVARARALGRQLARRYRDAPLIWVLGGDRPSEGVEPIWAAMAEGLGEVGGSNLMTYHPNRTHAARWPHDQLWLDFTMVQSGHRAAVTRNDRLIDAAYAREPVRPCLDAETNYEDHPIDRNPALGWFDAHDVRRAAYWSAFAGACGVTYGCHDVWQFYSDRHEPVCHARTPWREALTLSGAQQMQYLRALLESRPYLTRVPDQRLLPDNPTDDAAHQRATCDRPVGGAATYLMAYAPLAGRVVLDTHPIAGERLSVWWFDPRTGHAHSVGDLPNTGQVALDTPASDPDWVLVVDDAAYAYSPPGSARLLQR